MDSLLDSVGITLSAVCLIVCCSCAGILIVIQSQLHLDSGFILNPSSLVKTVVRIHSLLSSESALTNSLHNIYLIAFFLNVVLFL